MIAQNHSIDRIHLKLRFRSEKSAFRRQEDYLQYFEKQALPALTALLDRFDRPDTVLRIDRLQLDLGELPTDGAPAVMVSKFIAELERKLTEMAHSPGLTGEGWEEVPLTVSKLQAVARFLKTGAFPNRMTADDFHRELNLLWTKTPADFFSELVHAYREKGAVILQRMSYQFDTSLLFQILRQGLGEELGEQLQAFWTRWIQYEPPAEKKFRSIFWSSALSLALDHKKRHVPKIGAFLSLLIQQSRRLSLPLSDLETQIPPTWGPVLREVLGKDQAREVIPGAGKETRNEPAPSEEPAGIYCSNAGIVLLHPFLAPYFQEFNLLNATGDAFTGPETQVRAVYLLHYLATGDWAPPEFQLPLPKLLCGLPIDYPIPRDFTLEEAEISESSQLLRAVIQHWSALGKTSETGLREGFLQREGKLAFEKNHWLLKTERKTMDILLDKLPWSFARIKLPWMKHFLRTEWA